MTVSSDGMISLTLFIKVISYDDKVVYKSGHLQSCVSSKCWWWRGRSPQGIQHRMSLNRMRWWREILDTNLSIRILPVLNKSVSPGLYLITQDSHNNTHPTRITQIPGDSQEMMRQQWAGERERRGKYCLFCLFIPFVQYKLLIHRKSCPCDSMQLSFMQREMWTNSSLIPRLTFNSWR